MRSVNLSTLKAHLSDHIRFVSTGEDVIILNRNKPVARISHINGDDFTEQQQRLIAEGKITPPLSTKRIKLPLPTNKKPISEETMRQIWLEERGD